MRLFPTKVPSFVQTWFPNVLWKGEIVANKQTLYLTFDDGPDQKSTPLLLDILSRYNVPATFFLTGQRAEQFPELVDEMKSQGHVLGNHGYQHHSGWQMSIDQFEENTRRGREIVGSKLFRPPYGKLTKMQYDSCHRTDQLIYWSLMPGDFLKSVSAQKCKENIVNSAKNGDIIVLHDQAQLYDKITNYLPWTIATLQDMGYQFGVLSDLD